MGTSELSPSTGTGRVTPYWPGRVALFHGAGVPVTPLGPRPPAPTQPFPRRVLTAGWALTPTWRWGGTWKGPTTPRPGGAKATQMCVCGGLVLTRTTSLVWGLRGGTEERRRGGAARGKGTQPGTCEGWVAGVESCQAAPLTPPTPQNTPGPQSPPVPWVLAAFGTPVPKPGGGGG